MLIVKGGNLKDLDGWTIYEDVVIKTSAIEPRFNNKSMVILIQVIRYDEYTQWQQYQEDNPDSDVEPQFSEKILQCQSEIVKPIPYDAQTFSSYQKQNEYVKNFLISKGIDENNIQIVDQL